MSKDSVQEDINTRSDISLTPLALPMIAGPGAISLLITFNQEYIGLVNVIIILGAIVISTLFVFLILRSSFVIVKAMGASGINALSRIIGFIVIAIGVEFITAAITSIFHIK
jgi:multiple antibiotic resistance protein